MKKFLICLTLFGVTAMSYGQRNPEKRFDRLVEKINEKEMLSEEKKSDLETIFKDFIEAMKEMNRKKRSEMKELSEERDEKIKELLTEEQYSVYKEMIERRRPKQRGGPRRDE